MCFFCSVLTKFGVFWRIQTNRPRPSRGCALGGSGGRDTRREVGYFFSCRLCLIKRFKNLLGQSQPGGSHFPRDLTPLGPPPSWGRRDEGRRRQPVPGASPAPGGSERWMMSKIQHTKETEKHGFGINLAPQAGFAGGVPLEIPDWHPNSSEEECCEHGKTLGKLASKGINLPKSGPTGTGSGRNWQHHPSNPCQIWPSP